MLPEAHEVTAREHGIDALKGVAIILVIGIHASVGRHDFDDRLITIGAAWLWASVPVFMLVSAYFLARELDRQPARAAVARRLVRLVPLYAVWTVAYVVLALIAGGSYRARLRAQSVGGILFLGDGWYHLYFLPALVQVVIVVPLLRRVVATRVAAWLVFAAGCAVLALGPFTGSRHVPVAALHHASLAHPLNRHWLVVWLPSAAVGAALAARSLRPRRWLAWCLVGLAIVTLEGVVASRTHPPFTTDYARGGLPVLAVGLFVAARGWRAPPAWLTRLGRQSLGVFLAHPIVLLVLDRAHHAASVAAIVVTVVAVTAITWVLVEVALRTPARVLVGAPLRPR